MTNPAGRDTQHGLREWLCQDMPLQAVPIEEDRVPAVTSRPTQSLTKPPRLGLAIATSLAGRGAAALASLLLIPVTLGYLGPESYGLWTSVASVTSMLLWADLGLGNALMTRLTPLITRRRVQEGRELVSGAYAALGATAVVMLGLVWALSRVIPWADVLAGGGATLDSRAVILVCLTAFFTNLPLSLIQRVLYANQRVWQSNLWQLAGSAISVIAAALAVQARLDPLAVIACAVSGPLIANLVCSLWVFGRETPSLRPSLRCATRRSLALVAGTGSAFLVVTVTSSVALNLDNLIVAHTLGLFEVTRLALPVKLYTVLGLIVGAVNLPFWPANAEAIARGDVAWVRRNTARMVVVSALAVALPAMLLMAVGRDGLLLATGFDIGDVPTLVAGLALWWILLAVASPLFMVQNARAVLLPQLVGWLIFLVWSVPAKLLLLPVCGLEALPLVSAALYALTVLPAAWIGYRRALLSRERPRTPVRA
jgi:O-antigen/teichoic acid export membrane protein